MNGTTALAARVGRALACARRTAGASSGIVVSFVRASGRVRFEMDLDEAAMRPAHAFGHARRHGTRA